jgi:hypothetical protein
MIFSALFGSFAILVAGVSAGILGWATAYLSGNPTMGWSVAIGAMATWVGLWSGATVYERWDRTADWAERERGMVRPWSTHDTSR